MTQQERRPFARVDYSDPFFQSVCVGCQADSGLAQRGAHGQESSHRSASVHGRLFASDCPDPSGTSAHFRPQHFRQGPRTHSKMDLQRLAAESLAAGSDVPDDERQVGGMQLQLHPYHRTKAGSRPFKLIAMEGCPEAIIVQLQKATCELCDLYASSEDPLYPGYFMEWTYYNNKPGPRLIASRACDSVPIDQRFGIRLLVV